MGDTTSKNNTKRPIVTLSNQPLHYAQVQWSSQKDLLLPALRRQLCKCVRGNHGATKHRDSWALGRWLAPAMSQRLTAVSRQRANAHTCKSPGLRYNAEVLTRAIHEKETASPQWNHASVLNVAWGTLFFKILLTGDLRCNWSIFRMRKTIFSLRCW